LADVWTYVVKSIHIEFTKENAEKSVKIKHMADFTVHTDYVSVHVCSTEIS
jgi:hypothetical protein